MMQAARDVCSMQDIAGPHSASGFDRRPHHMGRCEMHAGEGGVVLGAETVRKVSIDERADAPHRGDVVAGMDERDLVVRRHRCGHDLEGAVPNDAEGARQPHCEVDADRREWMGGAEVVLRQRLVENDTRLTTHC
jgi:hypothetical protein